VQGNEKLDFLQAVLKDASSEGAAAPKPRAQQARGQNNKGKTNTTSTADVLAHDDDSADQEHNAAEAEVGAPVVSAYTLGDDDDDDDEAEDNS
jgi:hypothetical protein